MNQSVRREYQSPRGSVRGPASGSGVLRFLDLAQLSSVLTTYNRTRVKYTTNAD